MAQKIGRLHLATLMACIVVGMAITASASFAFDVVASFPDNQGDNSLWVQSCPAATGVCTDLPDNGVCNFIDPSGYPWVFKNVTGVYAVYAPASTIDGVISFKATTAGYYAYASTWLPAEGATGSSKVLVFKNSGVTTPDSWGNITPQTQPFVLSGSVPLNAGDYLRFAVDALGDNSADWVLATDWSINYTKPLPEPTTIATLGFGLLATAMATIRRRRA